MPVHEMLDQSCFDGFFGQGFVASFLLIIFFKIGVDVGDECNGFAVRRIKRR